MDALSGRLMKSLWKPIKAWRSRRQYRALQRWEQTRVEGKRWFIFRSSLTSGLTVAGATHPSHYLVHGASSWPVSSLFSLRSLASI